MYANILCNEAAFKHGITEAQIRYAVAHYALDIPIEDEMNKNLLIGTDKSANLLEIMYNEVDGIDGKTINVFHAMKLRRSFYALLDIQRKNL
ncbi:MAG: hypothetical protein Ta2A_16840 [Treponemataceae bacterium]|nr:MAG: hypothetical protein Ta2A_16840 [Treponemataceae bacterium]